MNNLTIKNGNQEDSDYIIEKLVEYNLSKVPQTQEVAYVWLNKIVENDDKEVVGGILAKMYCWNVIYIDALWINENYRGFGLGEKLLFEIENIAKKEKCYLIHLDTFDFQAKNFYIKNGYEVFGVLDDCPKDHKRFFLKKYLE
ncbi:MULTISPECIES: GNAT family N-acetyltransferase [Terrisporobacter]|uniref:GNAT family N-acetyltransferase n=1 Tax=Terrisporobacter muris TaxID=2963284 RepID=A0A9X2S4R0_9FIRM|nr:MULTISPECIES: GNAT family N-acetyltransferase [Terrisporobacter]MCC3668962.1 GNAT family N-acetyltransferase [Terrisporobacter mayombei]MCR1824462.1 GNAT family N-acetyltransferase [Terrisporobacter muris]MDY3372669.1 GNAT family N-acetyltransferase [Terrisporobacter othiniensis]